MSSRILSVVVALVFFVGCTPPPGGPSDAGTDQTLASSPDFVLDLEAAASRPPLRANVPIPAPGDAGTCLCSNGQGATPSWCPCFPSTPVGLPDGGAGAIWYESDAGTVVALAACPNGDILEWAAGFPTCVPISDAGLLPDAGAGGLWYQGDAGPGGPVGFPECTSSQVLGWSASANVPVCITTGGDLTGAIAANTVAKINGATVPAGGGLTTGFALQVSGPASLTYSPINLAGGSNYVTGVLPVGNLPNLAGDVTGAITSSAVVNLSGGSTPGTITITSPTLSASQATTLKTTAGALTVDSFTALNLGTSTASSVVLGSNSATAVTLKVATGDTATVAVNGTTVDQFGSGTSVFGASSAYAIDFNSTVTSATIGFSAAAAGSGTELDVIGQNAGAGGAGGNIKQVAGTGQGAGNGGSYTISGGGGGASGNPGNVFLNVVSPGGSTHGVTYFSESLVGYASIADAYSVSYAPAPAATVNPSSVYLYGSSPNGSCGSSATCTPGNVIVDISAVGGSGAPTHGAFVVNEANTTEGSIGATQAIFTNTGNAGTTATLITQITGAGTTSGLQANDASGNAQAIIGYYSTGSELRINGYGNGAGLNSNFYWNSVLQMSVQSGIVGMFGTIAAPTFSWDAASGTNTSQTATTFRKMYLAQPASSTVATFVTVAIPASKAVTIVQAADTRNHTASSTTGLGGCSISNTFYNNAGTVTSAGTVATIWAQGLGGCQYAISGTNVLVQLNNTSLATVDAQSIVDVTTD